jgi:hypothetical protein
MAFSKESFYIDLKANRPEYGSMLTLGINLPYMPTPQNVSTFAQQIVDFLKIIRGIELDYSVSSLQFVEAVLQGFHTNQENVDENALFIFSIGCYIGEVIAKKCGGKWINASDANWPVPVSSMAIVIKLPNGLFIDPIAKAFRRSYYGEADSIGTYYLELASVNS